MKMGCRIKYAKVDYDKYSTIILARGDKKNNLVRIQYYYEMLNVFNNL